MKIYTLGSYKNGNRELVFRELSDWHRREIMTCVLTGGEAQGDDLYACQWAAENNVEYREYKPDWASRKGGEAIARNHLMYGKEHPDLILAFPGARGEESLRSLAKEGKTMFVKVSA